MKAIYDFASKPYRIDFDGPLPTRLYVEVETFWDGRFDAATSLEAMPLPGLADFRVNQVEIRGGVDVSTTDGPAYLTAIVRAYLDKVA